VLRIGGIRLSLEARLLLPLFALAGVLLFADAVREFEDEADNLLGAVLIARGARLYADYFSSHMPFVYYLSALPALLGAWTIDDFRLFSNLLLLAATAWIGWSFRPHLPEGVMLTWAVVAVFAHRVQWGEMLHAGTVAGFGVLAAGLLFYTRPALRFSLRDKLALSLAVFVAVQSSQLAVFPLLLLAICYVAVLLFSRSGESWSARLREGGSTLAIVAAPHLVLLAWFGAIGALPAFVYDAYLFNQRYYSQYLMNGSTLGMLHDWEAQYRTYLVLNAARPWTIDFYLIVAVFGATVLTWSRRGPLVAILFYVFIGLTRVRAEGSYYLSAYLCVAMCLVWAAVRLARWTRPGGWGSLIAAAAFALLSVGFVVNVSRLYDFTRHPAYRSPYASIVGAITQPGERIMVAPYDPYLFLATQRLPATRYGFFFPWQAADPSMQADILAELDQARPPVVVFMQDERVNGQYRTGDWGRAMLDELERDYVAVAPADPVLANVFVRPDRVAAARAALGVAADGTAPAPQP
jgi:hypothetical protein